MSDVVEDGHTPIECPECDGEGCELCNGMGIAQMKDEEVELVDRLMAAAASESSDTSGDR